MWTFPLATHVYCSQITHGQRDNNSEEFSEFTVVQKWLTLDLLVQKVILANLSPSAIYGAEVASPAPVHESRINFVM